MNCGKTIDSNTLFTQVMMGGAWFTESFGDVDTCSVDAIADLAVRTAADHLHIHERPFRVIPHVHKVCWRSANYFFGTSITPIFLYCNDMYLYQFVMLDIFHS